MKHRNSQRGFSLIELAIVTAVAGLIAGAILTGGNLISKARVNKTIRQVSDTETSVTAFRLKYNHLPGDLPNPQAYFSSGYINANGSPGHGDGNDLIDGLANAATLTTSLASTGEPAVFYHQLYDAGYITQPMTYLDLDPGSYALDAASTNSGMFLPAGTGRGAMIAPFTANSRNYLLIVGAATGPAVNGAVTAGPALIPIQASDIDYKIDDGLPTTGNVVSTSATAPSATLGNGRPLLTPTVDGVDCYDATTFGEYLKDYKLQSCNLAILQSCNPYFLLDRFQPIKSGYAPPRPSLYSLPVA